jgi:hypothetical protein
MHAAAGATQKGRGGVATAKRVEGSPTPAPPPTMLLRHMCGRVCRAEAQHEQHAQGPPLCQAQHPRLSFRRECEICKLVYTV